MARTYEYKVTDEILKRFNELVANGYSKAAAAREVKVNITTITDHIERLANNKLNIEYALIKNKGNNYTFIVNGRLYKVVGSDVLDFHEDLVHRQDYKMSRTEFNKYFGEPTTKKLAVVKKAVGKNLVVKNKSLLYKGTKLPKSLLKLVNEVAGKSECDQRIVRFVELLIKNPDQYVIDQLYAFIKFNDIEICPNGYVMAYKAVTANFLDCRTKTIDNRVGATPKMDRKDVDPDPNVTCSRGLHVASLSYVNKLYDRDRFRVVACVISPEHFVSIPVDYNGAKARVCQYRVVKEI